MCRPFLQGHGEAIVVVVDDLAVIVRRLVVRLLGELTRGDFHRVWPFREVPDHGDPVDTRDDNDDGSDNTHRDCDNGVELAGGRVPSGLRAVSTLPQIGTEERARERGNQADDAVSGYPHEPPVAEVHVPADRRENVSDDAEDGGDDECQQVCAR